MLSKKMTAPELLKAEMPLVRLVERNLIGYGYIKGTPEWFQAFGTELAYYRQFGNGNYGENHAY